MHIFCVWVTQESNPQFWHCKSHVLPPEPYDGTDGTAAVSICPCRWYFPYQWPGFGRLGSLCMFVIFSQGGWCFFYIFYPGTNYYLKDQTCWSHVSLSHALTLCTHTISFTWTIVFTLTFSCLSQCGFYWCCFTSCYFHGKPPATHSLFF